MAVVINVVGNFDDKEIGRAQRELAKLNSSGKRTSSGFKSSLGSMTKGLIGFGASAFAVQKVGQAFVHLASEAQESVSIGKSTEAIIKATGGAAGVTAKQVSDLSTALSNKTGIDDEAIQKGQNLLLTFKEVRNEAGKGNDVFNRASAAALDLSKAGFGSIESASKQLGKALNDPIKGTSALSRAGVQFTDQQKKQIETLVKSGKTLEAQKIILGEVESQVGGVAEAAASPIERLQTMWGNFQEELGSKLLPVLSTLADTLGPVLTQIAGPLGQVLGQVASSLASAFQAVIPILQPIANALTSVAKVVGSFLSTALKQLVPVLMPILNIFADLIGQLGPILQPLLQKVAVLFGEIVRALAPLIPPLVKVVQQIFKAAAPIIGAVIDVLIGLVKAFAPLIPVIAKLLPPITRLVMAVLKALMPIIEPLLPIITQLATVLANVLGGAVSTLTDGLNAILPLFEKATGWIGEFYGNIISTFGDIPGKMLEIGGNLVSGLWDGISGAGSWLKDKILSWAGDLLPGWVKDILGISSPSKVFADIGGHVAGGMAKGITDGSSQVQKAAEAMATSASASAEAVAAKAYVNAQRGIQKASKGTGPLGLVPRVDMKADTDAKKAVTDRLKTITDAATDALEKFKEKAKAFFDFRDQIRDSLTSFGSVGGIQIDSGDFTPNAQGVIAYLQDRLRKIKEFGKVIGDLKKLGLNNASLQEIISAGPEAGTAIATALIAEGKKAVSEVNTLESQIRSSATSAGTLGAESQFGMTAANARGMQTTNITVKDGAVVVNVGAGTSASDAQAIKKAVDDAVRQALKKAKQDAAR